MRCGRGPWLARTPGEVAKELRGGEAGGLSDLGTEGIGGVLDASTTWMADAIEAYPATLPCLASSHILDGCGHWIQQERHQEANEILTGWLASLPA